MEFPFSISQVLDIKEDGFVMLCSLNFLSDNPKLSSKSSTETITKNLVQLINILGEQSHQAQPLGSMRTSFNKLARNPDSKVFIKADLDRIYGFLVLKPKDYPDVPRDDNCPRLLCLTDFYVHESVQRTGVGKTIFERMLSVEKIHSSQIAYKNPSNELLSFLRKYYGLTDYTTLPKGVVIYNIDENLSPTAKDCSQDSPIEVNKTEKSSQNVSNFVCFI